MRRQRVKEMLECSHMHLSIILSVVWNRSNSLKQKLCYSLLKCRLINLNFGIAFIYIYSFTLLTLVILLYFKFLSSTLRCFLKLTCRENLVNAEITYVQVSDIYLCILASKGIFSVMESYNT
jgi:hypothetical protein